MPSLSDFGLNSDAPESERRRARGDFLRHDDESGARPLPREAYQPLDEDDYDEIPVSGSSAGFYFGIGAGIGVAVLAIGSALYFGGYVDRPTLGPAPQASTLVPETRLAPLQAATDEQALAAARVADMKLLVSPVFAAPPPLESPDIRVIGEEPRPPERSPAPTNPPRPSNLTEELEALDRAHPVPAPLPPPARPTAPAETAPPAETSPPQNPY